MRCEKLFEVVAAVAQRVSRTNWKPSTAAFASRAIRDKGMSLESGLPEARRQQHFRDGREQSAQRAEGRPQHRRRRRRPDGRRFGGHRNRHRQDEQARRRAGLRPGRQSEDRREPGLRRLHHEHLRRAVWKSASWIEQTRPRAEPRHGVLQTRRHRRYRRDHRPHGHSRRRTTSAASSAWANRRPSAASRPSATPSPTPSASAFRVCR